MLTLRSIALLTAALGFSLTACNLDSDGDGDSDGGAGNNNGGNNNGGGGGGKLAGKFFGGGRDNAAGGEGEGEGEGEGDGEGEGGPGGEGEGEGEGEGGGSVSAGTCGSVCGAIVGCLNQVCELGLDPQAIQEAIGECAPACAEEATPEEVEQVSQLAGENCAGFAQAAQEGLCEEFSGDDFEEPDGGEGGDDVPVPPSGGGASAGDCQNFCQTSARCCAELDECEDQPPPDQCQALCQQYIPRPLVECVARASGQSCQAIEQTCADVIDDFEGGEGEGEGEVPAGGCDEELFCEYVSCIQGCGANEECGRECVQMCIDNPAACQCAPEVAQSCIQ